MASSALNFAALEASLLADALPERARTAARRATAPVGPRENEKRRDSALPAEAKKSPVSSASRAAAYLYPKSLGSANNGVALFSSAPASAAAGVRTRTASSALRAESLRCAVRATPQRVSAGARANARADDALRRFHECAAVPNASVDGALRDVVDLSLAAEEVCAVDDWEKAE